MHLDGMACFMTSTAPHLLPLSSEPGIIELWASRKMILHIIRDVGLVLFAFHCLGPGSVGLKLEDEDIMQPCNEEAVIVILTARK